MLAAAAPWQGAALRDAFRKKIAAVNDWSAIIHAAEAHGLTPLLCHRLVTAAADLIEPDLLTAARIVLESRQAAAEAAVAELDAILSNLAQSGIVAIPFKGPVFGMQAFGDPALRGFRDLDFLIRPDDIAATLRALAGLGYRSTVADLSPRRLRDYHHYNGQDILFAPDRLPVEPHWAFAPRTFGLALDPAPFRARAGRIAIGDRSFPCLSPEDAFIVACVHGGKEQWARAIWIADIAALIGRHETMDWDKVLTRSAAAGVRRMTLLGAHLAKRVMHVTLPRILDRDIEDDPVVNRFGDSIRAGLLAGGPVPASVFALSRFHWRLRERWQDRLSYATRTLTTARVTHFRSIDLPVPLSFLYPIVRLCHDFVALPVWQALKVRRP